MEERHSTDSTLPTLSITALDMPLQPEERSTRDLARITQHEIKHTFCILMRGCDSQEIGHGRQRLMACAVVLAR